jgi:hypothetical protein
VCIGSRAFNDINNGGTVMALLVSYAGICLVAYMFGGAYNLISVQFMLFMGYAYIKWDQEDEAKKRKEEQEDIFYGD